MSFEMATLNELLEVTSSKRIHMADYVPTGVPFYRGKEVIERANGNSVSTELFIQPNQYEKIKGKFGSPKDGDILLTSVGTLGVAYYVNGDGDFYFKDGNLTWFKNFKNTVNSRFIYYWLISPKTQKKLDQISIGSTQRALTIRALKALSIKLPSLEEQNVIVSILDALSSRIALLRETNKTLESIAQTIFKSWFVDFDPVRAKMEGRQPEGMDAETAALFPDAFEEGIPKGWRSGSLSELSSLNPQSWTAKRHPEIIEYIDLSNVKNNQIIAVMDIQYDDAPSRARRILSSGDTIIGTVRPGNRAFAYIFDPSENLTGSTGFAVLRPLKENNAEYIYLAATQDASIDYLAHIADGGAYPAVRPEVVASLPCVITDDPVKQLFHELAFPLFAKVSNNQRMIVHLQQLRDTLLPHLISGRLRISEEIGMAEAIEA